MPPETMGTISKENLTYFSRFCHCVEMGDFFLYDITYTAITKIASSK